jgi:phospholipase C
VRLSTPSLLFAVITAGIALAQDPSGVQGKIKHVIVVIQENRTTDNLFGSNPTFETGVNISPQAGLPSNCSTYTMPLAPQPLYTTWDIGHSYEDFQDMWNGGAMNGAWDENYNLWCRNQLRRLTRHSATVCLCGQHP